MKIFKVSLLVAVASSIGEIFFGNLADSEKDISNLTWVLLSIGTVCFFVSGLCVATLIISRIALLFYLSVCKTELMAIANTSASKAIDKTVCLMGAGRNVMEIKKMRQLIFTIPVCLLFACSESDSPAITSFQEYPSGCSTGAYQTSISSHLGEFAPGLNRSDVENGIRKIANTFYEQIDALPNQNCNFNAEVWYSIGYSKSDLPINFEISADKKGVCVNAIDEVAQVTSEYPSHWRKVEDHPVLKRQRVFDALCFSETGNFRGYVKNE